LRELSSLIGRGRERGSGRVYGKKKRKERESVRARSRAEKAQMFQVSGRGVAGT